MEGKIATLSLKNTRDISDPKEKARQQLQNLLKQLPAEATGVYVLGLSLFQDLMVWLTIAFAIGLILLIAFRRKAGASTTIMIMSIVGYFVWVYGIGNGPINALADSLNVPDGVSVFAVGVYSAVVAYFTIEPPASEPD